MLMFTFRFGLDYKETITFDEFISYFDDNPKVRKEMAVHSNHIELVNLANSTPLLALNKENEKTKRVFRPELSAAYCFAMLKAKARSLDFDPREHFPDECFELKGLVMPYHLSHMLRTMNLELSDSEFNKLWDRFDSKNVGGIRTRLFLRLIDYNPNEVDVLVQQNNMLRTKSFILSAPSSNNKNPSAKPTSTKTNAMKSDLKLNNNESSRHFMRSSTNLFDTKIVSAPLPLNNESVAQKEEMAQESEEEQPSKLEETSGVKFNEKEKQQRNQSTVSEYRIKSMAQFLKNSTKFGPHEDLVSFINNKVYIYI